MGNPLDPIGEADFSKDWIQYGHSRGKATPAPPRGNPPGLAIGGSATLQHTRFDGGRSTAYGVGPQISYFFGRGERALYPYLSAGASYATFRGVDSGSLAYAGSAGLLFMLNEAVGLNSSVSYQVQTWTGEDSDDPSIHTMGLGVGISAFVF